MLSCPLFPLRSQEDSHVWSAHVDGACAAGAQARRAGRPASHADAGPHRREGALTLSYVTSLPGGGCYGSYGGGYGSYGYAPPVTDPRTPASAHEGPSQGKDHDRDGDDSGDGCQARRGVTADGRTVNAETLAKLLTKERPVLVARDGKKPDPFLLQLYKEDAIVLVLPANTLGGGYGGSSILPYPRSPERAMPKGEERPPLPRPPTDKRDKRDE